MLARAVEDTRVAPNVAYLRGDAIRLPFRDGAFDAICCFAALHLLDEPLAALEERGFDDVRRRVSGPRPVRGRPPSGRHVDEHGAGTARPRTRRSPA
jgi:SAM-dependent methyltransferase